MKRVPISLARAARVPCRSRVFHYLQPIPAPLGYTFGQPASRTVVSCAPQTSSFNFHSYSTATKSSGHDHEKTNVKCFVPGFFSLPHPHKMKKGGEDANFVSSDYRVIAVADGVGGWNDVGVDPGQYSKALMEGVKLYCAYNIDPEPEKFSQIYDPMTIMDAGYKFASKIVGSSTCCVCVLDGLKLRVANLGDSGFAVIRNGKVIHYSDPQQHAFNFPYQLGTQSADLPEHSETFETTVEMGDYVIAATDGVFDNVSPATIATLIDASLTSTQLAEKIGTHARTLAEKRTGDTPFSIMAQNHGYDFKGGKLDDITVVVGKVSEDNSCVYC